MSNRTVEATKAERTSPLPGDDLIGHPIASLTHAITIHRPSREVWPWIAQMGAGNRSGWYSYDFIDNGGHPSAASIVPELQHLAVGMIFPALPGATDAFTLLAFESGRFLILGVPLPNAPPVMTWAFVLEPGADDSTRLIVRARGGPGYQFKRVPRWLTGSVVPFVHFVMQRKQLLNIARLAERRA